MVAAEIPAAEATVIPDLVMVLMVSVVLIVLIVLLVLIISSYQKKLPTSITRGERGYISPL